MIRKQQSFLFLVTFTFVALMNRPVLAGAQTQIIQLSDLKRPVTTVKEWLAQVEETEIVQVTAVKANPTDKGVEIILQTLGGQQLQLVNRSAGKHLLCRHSNNLKHNQRRQKTRHSQVSLTLKVMNRLNW
ncbi:MAG: hypothetical protein V7K89_29315 [Nostoc sp.]|uniref:hypothetical protein n=1 Tax=Nostoc sp. TaxID=1180 RepID=UPI002FFAFEE9